MKPTRGADAIKQRRFGAGHPDLAAGIAQQAEQSQPSRRVKMGGNLIEQQNRRPAALRPYQRDMRKHDREQQRLLFPR